MVGPVTSLKPNTIMRSGAGSAQQNGPGSWAKCADNQPAPWPFSAKQTACWNGNDVQKRQYEQLKLKFQRMRDVMIRHLQTLKQELKAAQRRGENTSALKCEYQKEFKHLEADIKEGEHYVMPSDVFSPADEAIALNLGLM